MSRWTMIAMSAVLLAGCGGCARNPVTGKNELSLVSESQEIAMGREAAQSTLQSIGEYEDPEVQQYVARLGKELAARSERPDLPWEFHVVNDASVNAFALPGGFIFITRGIMTHMNNEAELVSVLGHEIGHVTAKHSVQQISRAQLAQVGLVAGSILSSDIARFAGIASQGLGLLFLKYGRDAENQADDLGFKYMIGEGYDPRAQAEMFETLARVGEASGGGKLPEWASTHPNPENRVQNTLERIDSAGRPSDRLTVGRAEYLRLVEGMPFGDDPRQGFFRNGVFYHPDLRFQIAFPQGWQTQNLPQVVAGISPQQDAIVQLSLAGQVPPQQAAQQFLSQQGVRAGQTSTSSVNGLPAATSYFEAQTEQGVVQGIVSFISYGNRTYQLVGYTPGGKLQSYDQLFRRSIGTFGDVDDPSVLNVQPARVELVRLSRDMTVEQFNAQYPSSVPLQQVAIINGVDPGATLRSGQSVKRVVGGLPQGG